MAFLMVEFQISLQNYHYLLLHSHLKLPTPQILANEWERKKWIHSIQSTPMYVSGLSSEVGVYFYGEI